MGSIRRLLNSFEMCVDVCKGSWLCVVCCHDVFNVCVSYMLLRFIGPCVL